VQSFLIDGEAVVCRPDGVSDFEALRVGRRAHEVTLVAFDLLELEGDDLRNEPLFNRKQRLARILSRGPGAIIYNEQITHDGPTVFDHACRLGLEGIVSKRLDAPYRSGLCKSWLNPIAVTALSASTNVNSNGRLRVLVSLARRLSKVSPQPARLKAARQ